MPSKTMPWKDEPIVCDIDGVLASFDECFRRAMWSVLDVDHRDSPAQVWDLIDAYGITPQQHDEVWKSRVLQLYMAAAPRTALAQCISRSLPAGSFYVTARGSSLKYATAVEFRKLTIEWLIINNFPDFPVIFSDDKVEFCQRHGITHAIDDAPHHAQAYNDAGITCYMPVMPYNRHKIDLPKVVPLEKAW
jgi:hypothetical protein